MIPKRFIGVAFCLLTPIVSWLATAGFSRAMETCNGILMGPDIGACWAEYDDAVLCGSRSSESECESSPGAGMAWSTWPVPATSYYAECSEQTGPNTAHCVMAQEPEQCIQKYYCDWDGEKCDPGAAWDPESWWATNKALSPSCVPGGE